MLEQRGSEHPPSHLDFLFISIIIIHSYHKGTFSAPTSKGTEADNLCGVFYEASTHSLGANVPTVAAGNRFKACEMTGHQTGTGPAPYELKFRLPLQNAGSPLKKLWRRSLSHWVKSLHPQLRGGEVLHGQLLCCTASSVFRLTRQFPS